MTSGPSPPPSVRFCETIGMAQRQLPALCRRLLPGVRRCRGRDAWSPGGQWAWHSDGVGGDRCGIYLRRPKIAVALPAALPKLELANRIDRRPARPWRLTDGGMAAGAIRRTRRMQHRGAAPTDFAGSQRPSRRRWTLPPPRQYARVKPPSCRMLVNVTLIHTNCRPFASAAFFFRRSDISMSKSKPDPGSVSPLKNKLRPRRIFDFPESFRPKKRLRSPTASSEVE